MAVSQSLSVTEVAGSVNNSANTSKVRILWQSTQTGDSWNGYTRIAKYYVSINGGAETEYSVSYTLPKNATKTIVDTTITVNHKDDGSGTVKVRTWMETGINAGVVEKSDTISLTNIPRASTISSVSNVTLGNLCAVQWTPRSKDFRFKIKFAVGSWSLTTAAIHPNITTLYTNASYGISLEAAHQFPNSKDAEMTVTLYTYSDANCTKQVGTEQSAKCRVYIPEIKDTTLPTVAMSLYPVSTLSEQFNGLYIQNKTKVQASFEGSKAKYSASISSYSMNVNGSVYGNPYLSDLLSKSGTIPVSGTAVDSRGCSATTPQDIYVIPYSKPNLVPYDNEDYIVCKRCNADGTIANNGVCVRIKAKRQYSKVLAEGVQKNFCVMRFRYKAEGATSWGEWITILDKDNEADSVDAAITNINLSASTTYLVQMEVVDDVGESSLTLITIPTADITVHLRAGGKAIGVGKYAEKDNILDIDDEWELNARGEVRIGKTLHPNHIASIDSYSYKDFNELVYKTGYYSGTSAPSSVSATNYPINETGVLEVVSCMGQNAETLAWWGFAYQTYRTHNGLFYVRSYFSSTGWTAWKKVTLT
jgi:hypothetical protein